MTQAHTAPSPARGRPAAEAPVRAHNLGTVVGFEFTRTVKKRRFWIATLAIPVVMAIVFALVYLSNSSTARQRRRPEERGLSFTYTDDSGLIAARDRHGHGRQEAERPRRRARRT